MLEFFKKKNIYLIFYVNCSHNNNNNINKNSLWWGMKNHLINKSELSNLEKIFYTFIEIKDNININENINFILEKKIPINVYSFRKVFEERLINAKDTNLKEEYLNNLWLLNTNSTFNDKDGDFSGKIVGVSELGLLEVLKENKIKEYNLKEIHFNSRNVF